jgi:splicing factor 3B subunit 3
MKLQGKEILLCGTISGGLFAMVPLRSKEETTFFNHLEMYMRQEYVNLPGRDHLAFRSYFAPVKAVLDGELCEQYGALSLNKQNEFATDVDRTPTEIIKRLEEVRDFL